MLVALRRDDIRQIAQLPFTQSSIRRGVHSIYAKKPDEVDVQSTMPKWPKAGRWQIIDGSISTNHLIPTD
jgi:hypothetical protein